MFATLKRCVPLVRAAAHVSSAVVRVLFLFPWCDDKERRRQIANWSAEALAIFGLRISAAVPPVQPPGAQLLVSNHVSWLDVFAIWSQCDTTFVAKSEVGHWPVLGPLARRLGVIFIDRKKRRDSATVGREIAALLVRGRSVCIFPEGTSTEGGELQPFHAALFQPCVDVGAPVRPIAIRYFRRDGTRAVEAAFTDEMTLVQSMWQLAGADPIIIEIEHLPPIGAAGNDRRGLARRTHQAVANGLRRPVAGWTAGNDRSARWRSSHPIARSRLVWSKHAV